MNILINIFKPLETGSLFILAYVFISTGTTLLIPKYNQSKFLYLPKKNINTFLNKILYFIIIFYTIFLPASKNIYLQFVGIITYIFGLTFFTAAVFQFAVSEIDKPVTKNIFSFSRHPVYLSFFVLINGISIFSESIILFIINSLHFLNTVKIMKSEEIFCEKKYGNQYIEYKKKVRMII